MHAYTRPSIGVSCHAYIYIYIYVYVRIFQHVGYLNDQH